MQIVINISKKLYDRYKKTDHIKRCDIDEFEKALDKCIIIPKGHGRLIDEEQIPGDGGWDFSDRLMSTPTIIEADVRAESEVEE